ncbi:hypothetical protein Mapa_013093 [Marchantia paleacea]|nr:hypothetical protein Mapa_013093 [Marchantia paleacea]
MKLNRPSESCLQFYLLTVLDQIVIIAACISMHHSMQHRKELSNHSPRSNSDSVAMDYTCETGSELPELRKEHELGR